MTVILRKSLIAAITAIAFARITRKDADSDDGMATAFQLTRGTLHHALTPNLRHWQRNLRTTTRISNPQIRTTIESPPLISLQAAGISRPPTSSRNHNSDNEISRIDASDLAILRNQGYVIIDDFLTSEPLIEALRDDVRNLRQKNKFKIAKIGQDSTNTLNEEIRVAETCFLGRNKPELKDVHNQAREKLHDVLETLQIDLQQGGGNKLDPNLSEFLYAYYPSGGFYRRHRDAIKGSASWLREYSLLLYLNEKSYDPDKDGGRLRVHFDSGGDFLPDGEAPLFHDVDTYGGTLVIFESNKFPHEVLDTVAERFAVVGWYNRRMTLADLKDISNDRGSDGGIASDDPMRLVALAAAAGLVTVGLINILAP